MTISMAISAASNFAKRGWNDDLPRKAGLVLRRSSLMGPVLGPHSLHIRNIGRSMVMARHSPGPWQITREMGETHIRTADNESIMCDMRYYPWVPDDQDDWNLISAAPELLSALTECREICLIADDDGISVSEDVVLPSDLFQRICSAINKANGQS